MIFKQCFKPIWVISPNLRLGWFWQTFGGQCCVQELRSPTGYLGRWTIPEDFPKGAEDLRSDWVQRSIRLRCTGMTSI